MTVSVVRPQSGHGSPGLASLTYSSSNTQYWPVYDALVDIAVVQAALEQVLHHLRVLRARWCDGSGRSRDSSVFHCSRNSAEMTSVNSCGVLPGGLGGALDLLAVLIGAGGQSRRRNPACA